MRWIVLPILVSMEILINDDEAFKREAVRHGRDRGVLERRKQIKQKTMLLRRKQKRSFRLAEIEGKVYMNTETIS
jgi:hypothetical protein